VKRLGIAAILLMLVAVACLGQSAIVYNSTPTLEWNAVTTDAAGNPLLPEDAVAYNVFIWDTAHGLISSQPISALTFVATTSATSRVLSFPYRANWAAAVQAQVTDGEGIVSLGALAYSTDLMPITASGPFVYVPRGSTPPRPVGLRDSGI